MGGTRAEVEEKELRRVIMTVMPADNEQVGANLRH